MIYLDDHVIIGPNFCPNVTHNLMIGLLNSHFLFAHHESTFIPNIGLFLAAYIILAFQKCLSFGSIFFSLFGGPPININGICILFI